MVCIIHMRMHSVTPFYITCGTSRIHCYNFYCKQIYFRAETFEEFFFFLITRIGLEDIRAPALIVVFIVYETLVESLQPIDGLSAPIFLNGNINEIALHPQGLSLKIE